jgi:hypothetical protein
MYSTECEVDMSETELMYKSIYIYEGETINRPQMIMKRNVCGI